MIIAISGTPGTGKTAVADALGNAIGWHVMHLNDVAKSKKLWLGRDRRRKCMVVDVEALTEKVRLAHEQHGNLIIESHYAHDLEADVTVVLRCKPAELRARLEKKGWSKSKVDENVEAEIMEICRQEAWEFGRRIVDVDTTGKSPDEAAADVSRACLVSPHKKANKRKRL